MNEILNFVSTNSDAIIAITTSFAVFVSFLSIILTFASLILYRNHNFKSLTPIARFRISDYENHLSIKLENSGTGPLIVKNFSAIKQDGSIADILIDLIPNLPNSIYWKTFYYNPESVSVIPADSIDLLELEGKIDDPLFIEARNMVREHLSNIELKLEFQDIYKRKMPPKRQDLKWFSRHKTSSNKIALY